MAARAPDRWRLALPLLLPSLGGLAYLAAFGAPVRLIAVNAGALGPDVSASVGHGPTPAVGDPVVVDGHAVADAAAGLLDEGIEPLAHFLDGGGPDAVAVALESDGTGAVYPAVYLRRDGRVDEHLLDPHPLLDFEGEAYRRALVTLLAAFLPLPE